MSQGQDEESHSLSSVHSSLKVIDMKKVIANEGNINKRDDHALDKTPGTAKFGHRKHSSKMLARFGPPSRN